MSDKIKFKAHTEAAEHRTDLMIKSARGSGLVSVVAFLAAEIQRETKAAFLKQADPSTGQRWWERRREYPHPILRKTGTMWADVIADYWTEGFKGHAFAHTPKSSPSFAYSSKHQFGEESHQMDSIGEVVARPFAGQSLESKEKVVRHAQGPDGLLGS